MHYLILLIILVFCSCNQPEYSFFVAGHTYGKPEATNIGLHPPFLERFDWLNEQDNLEFGILTGDVVRSSTEEYWNAIQSELAQLKSEVFIAPGNHDMQHDYRNEKRFKKGYQYFQKFGDHFFILNPNLDRWNISGKQLEFLTEKLALIKDDKNIFVFSHQVLWWEKEGYFSSIRPNSFQSRSKELNFHSKVLNLFQSIDNETFMFAGDIGAITDWNSLTYHKKENIHFIASGMGGGKKDNFLLVSVGNDKQVSIEVVGLNCNTGFNCMGDVEDYLK